MDPGAGSEGPSPCTPSGALGTHLLGDGGMVVLQDEPLDVVSPAPFLLHSFGLGGPEGEGAGVIMTGLKPSSVRWASAEEGRGQRGPVLGAL